LGDAVCLTSPSKTALSAERGPPIHDGVVLDGQIYFTRVDGMVFCLDGSSGEIIHRYDLNSMTRDDAPLGWCRGFDTLGDGLFAIGFSRLRRTKWEENLKWVKHRFGGDGQGLRPTRVGLFHLERREIVAEFDLEAVGLNAVFSIHLMSPEAPYPFG
jgi:hypothetical protein